MTNVPTGPYLRCAACEVTASIVVAADDRPADVEADGAHLHDDARRLFVAGGALSKRIGVRA